MFSQTQAKNKEYLVKFLCNIEKNRKWKTPGTSKLISTDIDVNYYASEISM